MPQYIGKGDRAVIEDVVNDIVATCHGEPLSQEDRDRYVRRIFNLLQTESDPEPESLLDIFKKAFRGKGAFGNPFK